MIDEESRNEVSENAENPLDYSPTDFAASYANGTLLENGQVIHDGDRSTIYQCVMKDETLPDGSPGKFTVSYRRYKEPSAARPDQLRFDYEAPTKDHPDKETPVASMHLQLASPDHFVLEHRYVSPELRGSGIGTKLLTQVEEYLAAIAKAQQSEIRVSLDTGQIDVIRWIMKNKFKVSGDNEGVLRELLDSPEGFVTDNIAGMDSASGGNYLFRKDVKGRRFIDAIRLTFEKVISPSSSSSQPTQALK